MYKESKAERFKDKIGDIFLLILGVLGFPLFFSFLTGSRNIIHLLICSVVGLCIVSMFAEPDEEYEQGFMSMCYPFKVITDITAGFLLILSIILILPLLIPFLIYCILDLNSLTFAVLVALYIFAGAQFIAVWGRRFKAKKRLKAVSRDCPYYEFFFLITIPLCVAWYTFQIWHWWFFFILEVHKSIKIYTGNHQVKPCST